MYGSKGKASNPKGQQGAGSTNMTYSSEEVLPVNLDYRANAVSKPA